MVCVCGWGVGVGGGGGQTVGICELVAQNFA